MSHAPASHPGYEIERAHRLPTDGGTVTLLRRAPNADPSLPPFLVEVRQTDGTSMRHAPRSARAAMRLTTTIAAAA